MGYVQFFLAMIVALGHLQGPSLYGVGSWFSVYSVGSIVAVKLFFIISGFYMAMIIDAYPSARAFWSSRAIRLYPTYWLTICIAVIALLAFHSNVVGTFVSARFWTSDIPLYAKAAWSLMVMSFTGLDLGQYICVSYTPFNLHYTADASCGSRHYILGGEDLVPPAWTLSLEMYFYLLVPFIARLRDRNIAILALASFALAMWIAAVNNINPWYRTLFPAELYLFLLGMLVYRWRHEIARPSQLCAVAFLLIAIFYQHLPGHDLVNANGLNVILYAIFALSIPALFTFGGRLPLERAVGDLSYPIYISHIVTISIIQASGLHTTLPLYAWLAFNAACIIGLSWLLASATRPLEAVRHSFRNRARSPARGATEASVA